mmetsp:Transcript_89904/g.196775  ORF Transcript_89904/g.196775 Transcript_89904/m.196775 type:complete len:101 (+) Transcript_89904:138-440(+)
MHQIEAAWTGAFLLRLPQPSPPPPITSSSSGKVESSSRPTTAIQKYWTAVIAVHLRVDQGLASDDSLFKVGDAEDIDGTPDLFPVLACPQRPFRSPPSLT